MWFIVRELTNIQRKSSRSPLSSLKFSLMARVFVCWHYNCFTAILGDTVCQTLQLQKFFTHALATMQPNDEKLCMEFVENDQIKGNNHACSILAMNAKLVWSLETPDLQICDLMNNPSTNIATEKVYRIHKTLSNYIEDLRQNSQKRRNWWGRYYILEQCNW